MQHRQHRERCETNSLQVPRNEERFTGMQRGSTERERRPTLFTAERARTQLLRLGKIAMRAPPGPSRNPIRLPLRPPDCGRCTVIARSAFEGNCPELSMYLGRAPPRRQQNHSPGGAMPTERSHLNVHSHSILLFGTTSRSLPGKHWTLTFLLERS